VHGVSTGVRALCVHEVMSIIASLRYDYGVHLAISLRCNVL